MEFWGVEVKSGQPLKVTPELGKLIHISQAALGEVKDVKGGKNVREVKDVKGAKNVPIRLKIDDKNFIIGYLSAEKRPQVMFDLVFEKEFELSHDCKNGSVHFMGYIADDHPGSDVDGEDFSDESEDESEDELLPVHENGKIEPNSGDVKPAKGAALAKTVVKKEEKPDSVDDVKPAKDGVKKEEQPDSDDDEDDSEFDSDDEMALDVEEDSSDGSIEVSDEDGDEGFSSDEELPKVEQSKKRPAASAQKTPIPAKKAKSATPEKTGDKKGHIDTPFPSKGAGKTPGGNKPKQQTPKSGGQIACKSCSKSFTSEGALQSHSKAKHGGK